ncbi:MAG TPA: hypothetical protein VFS43_41250 [Polyangiaceae bacterium]|nr:hypothetical protein [Polyangiaceae bacterium]
MALSKPVFEFLPGQVFTTGVGLVDVRVDVLVEGALLVRARPYLALEQETFHCYVRHLAGAELPIAADDFCALLGADEPPSLTPDILAMAQAPLRPGEYDALLAPLTLRQQVHQGVRVSCPPSTTPSTDTIRTTSRGSSRWPPSKRRR